MPDVMDAPPTIEDVRGAVVELAQVTGRTTTEVESDLLSLTGGEADLDSLVPAVRALMD
jgi:hypothetical protein